MLITKEMEIKWHPANKNYYVSLGYIFTKFGNSFIIKVKDLLASSKEKVEVLCDYCGIVYQTPYSYYVRTLNNIIPKCSCKKCAPKKVKEIYSILTYDICANFNKFGENDIHIFDDVFMSKNITPLIDKYVDNYSYIPFNCNLHNKIFFNTIDSIKDKVTGCSECRSERAHQIKRLPDDFVLKTIIDKGYFVKDDFSYNSFNGYMTIYCVKHPEVPISAMYSNLISQRSCCRYCISENRTGEGGSNWKGGITSKSHSIRVSKEYEEWKNKVFTRDNYICQCCGYSDGKMLEAHHISNFSSNEEKRFDVSNGITLCKKCHNFKFSTSFHYMYGTSNNTEEQLCEYLELNKKISARTYTAEEKSNIYSWSKNIKFNCEFCGKETIRNEYFYNQSKNHFCSRQCLGKYRKLKKDN